jgi:signal transduction histidine kinase
MGVLPRQIDRSADAVWHGCPVSVPGQELGRESATPTSLLLAIRLVLLAVCVALSTATGSIQTNGWALCLLALTAVASSLPVRPGPAMRLQPVLAAVLAALVITVVAGAPVPLLPYLLAPVIDAGLVGGLVTAITASGLAAGAELAVSVANGRDDLGLAIASSSQWVLFTVAVGALAAWVRRLQRRPGPQPDPSYAAAYRLLSQLRLVSRQLAGGLDPVSLAQALLQTLHGSLQFDRAVCLARGGDGGRLVPLAYHGVSAADWAATLDAAGELTEAWIEGHPVAVSHRFDGSPGGAAAVVLRMGVRTFGIVAFEWDARPPDRAALVAVEPAVTEASLRLETALLFSDIRTIATAEERRRVAREIHDGIAQELASLGYVIDDLTARAGDNGLGDDLRTLRRELSRVVGELRLSIFDLRTEVRDAGGLGTAITDYVQQVGATSNLRVHIVLDEAPTRLPMDTETELLRVVQEAVTNARKHSRAENLWVSCTINPPDARISIEDDGVGLGQARSDSYGLMIMRERAERVGGTLDVGPRAPRGTSVTLTVHGSSARTDRVASAAARGREERER